MLKNYHKFVVVKLFPTFLKTFEVVISVCKKSKVEFLICTILTVFSIFWLPRVDHEQDMGKMGSL